ncbi:MAG: cation:proton antiporter, partial [Candidatus Micrarchaeota archaeon]|nr:cation:proton antiporter [Candidatus Micrarchaeota archaeon]
TTFLKGNGAIAALVFGLIIGNAPVFAKALKLGDKFDMEESIRHFQKEISFFVRTFFFVYLGILFDPSSLLSPTVVVMAGFIIAAILAARWTIASLFQARIRGFAAHNRLLLTGLISRGTAPAVLATLPAAYGISIPYFAEVAILTIMASNIMTTLAAFAFQRSLPAVPENALNPTPAAVSQTNRTARRRPRMVFQKEVKSQRRN